MDVSLFDYELPQELIAQTPARQRDESRLLIVNRKEGLLQETAFRQVVEYLQPGDVLVLNNTYVIPARLYGKKEPGGATIEVLLLQRLNKTDWDVITSRSSRLRAGGQIVFSASLRCELLSTPIEGKSRVRFVWEGDWGEVLQDHGEIPLPPYIQRQGTTDDTDRERYQTVFAQQDENLNSAAAPTAGLHFTDALFAQLKAKGVHVCSVTLRIGLDTFLPLRVEKVEEHKMHSETYCISPQTAEILNQAKRSNRRIIAVGTTSARVLESAGQQNTIIQPGTHSTSIFIYPGYRFQTVSALITNFHLPKSTLIMMVSAFMGNELRKKAYMYAVQNRFRFYSYGDAMLIV